MLLDTPASSPAKVALSCDQCGAHFEKWRKQLNPRHFCNSKCYGQYRAEHPEMQTVALEAMHRPEVREKISRSLKSRTERGFVHCRTGTTHTAETREKISRHHRETGCLSGEKNGMFGRSHTPEARAKISDAVSERILDGTFRPYGTRNSKGHYTSTKTGVEMFYRSSWELAFMKWLDANEQVKSYSYEPIRIPYKYNDNKRWYVPDFLVEWNEHVKYMYELKPKEFLNDEKTRAKCMAATGYAHNNGPGLYFHILTREELVEWGVL